MDAVEQKILAAVDAQRETLLAFAQDIGAHAEPGMQNIASTDVGDLSQVMPVVNFTHGGTAGALHSADFAVTDVDKAYIAPAKMMALTAYHLLKDGAVLARRTMDGFTPVFTRESYIETVRRQG